MRLTTIVMVLLFVYYATAQYLPIAPEEPNIWQLEHKSKQRGFYKVLNRTEPTTNQTHYDVTYYKLNLEVDPFRSNISGFTQISAKVVKESINTFELNFYDNMIVDSVVSNNNRLNFTQSNNLLTINLGKQFSVGETIALRVFYHGDPSRNGDSEAFVFTVYKSKPHFWTLSEPYGAREWWPCKDFPEDKADSADIIVTVPEGMSVASNGLLVSETTSNGKTTFHWQERYPIVTYLISITGYDYVRYSENYLTLDGNVMPIDFFVYPENYNDPDFRADYSLTKEMITAFAQYFGEYPFVNEKYGHAEFLWGGGMEHQTCSSLSYSSPGLIAHELAHQWWGDMITCRNFHHIWLNEGFATYCEALWREYDEGMAGYFDEIANDAYKGPGTIYVEDASNFDEIFDGNLSYSKAAYVLHMLRHVVGDSVFFDILQAYYADLRYQYETAITEDFQGVCEQVSGMNLGKFFQQWIYGEYYPQYEYSWKSQQENNRYRVDLTINQVQTNTGLFWMPIDVFIHFNNGDTVFVVWDSLQTQQFTFYVDQQPTGLGLDEDNWILCDKDEVPSALENESNAVVNDFRILNVYPNPFNPKVTIEFYVPQSSPVVVTVFNSSGQKIANANYQAQLTTGRHKVQFSLSTQASGVYYFVVKQGEQQKIAKALLIK